jgi:hypothetical protein
MRASMQRIHPLRDAPRVEPCGAAIGAQRGPKACNIRRVRADFLQLSPTERSGKADQRAFRADYADAGVKRRFVDAIE